MYTFVISDVLDECQGYTQFLFKKCVHQLDYHPTLCDSKLELNFVNVDGVHLRHAAFKYINELPTLERTFIVVGIGMHQEFLTFLNTRFFIDPFLNILKQKANGKSGPEILWVNPHLPGYLKPLHVPLQDTKHTIEYAKFIKEYLSKLCIPVMDTINITKHVMSWDGTHYGWGVNMLKADIVLNYIEHL